MTIVFLPLPAATKQIKRLVHRCSPARMSKHIQPLPVLQRPTAVDNAGEYRVIITRKQPDAGPCGRLSGQETPPWAEVWMAGGALMEMTVFQTVKSDWLRTQILDMLMTWMDSVVCKTNCSTQLVWGLRGFEPQVYRIQSVLLQQVIIDSLVTEVITANHARYNKQRSLTITRNHPG